MKARNIKITDEQDAWLEENIQINLSGLVRRAIDAEMKKDGKA